MRRLLRVPLAPEVVDALRNEQSAVDSAANPQAEALRRWKNVRAAVRTHIASQLRLMCSGLERCMYCEDSTGTDIDHFWPKGRYPAKAFVWENYLFACSTCNSNAKRDQFPTTAAGEPLLLNPVEDEPAQHLLLSPSTGIYQPTTARGKTSVAVFKLNREVCARGRLNAWVVLQVLFQHYRMARDSGDDEAADQIVRAISEHPFQGVREQMSLVFDASPNLLTEAARAALTRHPELLAR